MPTKRLGPQEKEVESEEEILKSGCCRTKNKSGESVIEDRKDGENH